MPWCSRCKESYYPDYGHVCTPRAPLTVAEVQAIVRKEVKRLLERQGKALKKRSSQPQGPEHG